MLEQIDIRNRITEIRRMRLGDVASNPNNWRGHPQEQRNVFKGVVEEIGWAGVPLAYHSERTGKLTYVDGHMRREELPNLEAEIAITDLSDAEADEFIMLYDPIARLAETDSEILAMLMRGTTTLDKDISEFLSKMAEQEGIIPNLDNVNNGKDESAMLQSKFQILIDCKNETTQVMLLEKLSTDGYECRAFVM